MNVRSLVKHATYRLATRLLGDADGFVRLPVFTGPARGLVLRVDLVRRGEAYWHGGYDREILKTLARHLLRPGMTVWDCGIYIGYYTCFFARQVGASGHVVAFEPDPVCLQRAKENVRLNGFRNVDWVAAAIGAATGTSPFIISGNTNSHLPGAWIGSTPREYASQVENKNSVSQVQVYTLDDAVNAAPGSPPDLIKIDIEGMEGQAVRHALHLIDRYHPAFVVELHNPECDRAVYDFFASAGYNIFNAENMRPLESVNESRGTLACLPRG